MLSVRLQSTLDKGNVYVDAWVDQVHLGRYQFLSEKKPHPIGIELVRATLLSWATIDLCFAQEVVLSDDLDPRVVIYIQQHYDLVTRTYTHLYGRPTASLLFKKIGDEQQTPFFYLDSNAYFLGYTGGKDSTLCQILLDVAQVKTVHYLVTYDNDQHSEEGHINFVLSQPEEYYKVSVVGANRQLGNVSFHQADDIHVTFAAPYFDLNSSKPAYLAVGLPWDVIHTFPNEGLCDLVPTETYCSLKILMDLFHALNVVNFKLISPIASLHTVGVYQVLSKILGIEKLMELDSCWHSYLFQGKPCGCCPKCQRLKFIFEYCFNQDYLSWSPTLKIESGNFLFGSLYAWQSINQHPDINWSQYSLVDVESTKFSGPFIEILKEKYNVPQIKVPHLNFKFEKDEQKWEEVQSQIISLIAIDYNRCLKDRLVEGNVPWLPFEEDYHWDRVHPVLACYGNWPVYDLEKQQWETLFIKDGPSLQVPDTELFRIWLNKRTVQRVMKGNGYE
ncbi:hypothetical protein [Laceyella tengchongensis]|uniref:hypothetical protein n=1 Tax=Laceyella tengchongensis TaxID=574699 RepID=UPI0012B7AFD9|nr:hypothetical protein [Laceyella tengchongensis]